MKTPFDIAKAAQAAHFFITRERGEMEILKLVKLLYLADRLSFQRRRTAIVGGSYYSLPHGPITNEVLDLINGGTPQGDSDWERLISDRAEHRVATVMPLSEYDALSASDLRLLEETWTSFGSQGKWELRDWTHQHCEEWSDPQGGRVDISALRLAESFGWSAAEAEAFEEALADQQRLHELIR
jgi:uncharacterized phage-associated protein